MAKYHKKYDWSFVQKEYDTGLSQRDICLKYGIALGTLYKAAKRGDISFRTKKEAASLAKIRKPHKHSEETKKKISEIRRKYLAENPEKVPYRLNHSSKRSYPEACFEKALNEAKIIGWVTEYPFGIYSFDFAFPEYRIDVEIDGATHTLPNVKHIDVNRDQLATEHGWKVIRFSAKEIKNDVKACINQLLELLSLPAIEYSLPIRPEKKIYYCVDCKIEVCYGSKRCSKCFSLKQRKVERPSIEQIKSDLSIMSYASVGKKYGVSDNCIRKWLK